MQRTKRALVDPSPLISVSRGHRKVPCAGIWARVLLLSVPFAGCGGPFADASHYSDVRGVSEAPQRGWVPDDLLPSDATNIWVFNFTATGATWGCFELPSGARGVLDRLTKVNAEHVSQGPLDLPPPPEPVRPWWPRADDMRRMEGYRYQESNGFGIVVGIYANGSRACFHRLEQ
jgi:hypothetical protein